MSGISKLRVATVLMPLLLVGACADLPDLSGYTAATVDVREAVASAGAAVDTEIGNAGKGMNEDDQKAILASQKQFRDSWAKSVQSMDAMVEYAQSIEALADAGNKGGESAGKVVDAVGGLAKKVGIPLDGIPVVDAVTSAGKFVLEQLARIKATRSLDAALAEARPAIARIHEIIGLQLDAAGVAFNAAIDGQVGILDYPAAYGNYAKLDDDLTKERTAEVEALSGLLGRPTPDAAAIKAAKDKIKAIDENRAVLAGPMGERAARLAVIETRRKAGLELLAASKAALTAWGVAHAKMVEAFKSRRPVTSASLSAAIDELRDVLEKWRKL